MLASPGPLPDGAGWAFEFKWDGVRAIVTLAAGRLGVASRNGRDITGGYPELADLTEALANRRLVLDGELVALAPTGAPSFALLQQRMHVRTPSAGLLARVPVRLYLFDVLYADGDLLTELPYLDRRAVLEDLGLTSGVVRTPDAWWDTPGADLLTAAGQYGLEGVIAKRLTSTYQPGRRSTSWIKVPLNTTTEVIVAGWHPGEGRRHGMIGSLLLGMRDSAGQLHYVGNVGTGFTQAALVELERQLQRLRRATAPFVTQIPREYARDAVWVEPDLVGEVVYRTWTPDRRLRHPSWRGLRADRTADEVRLPDEHLRQDS